jgi:hypothetical protein
MKSYSIQNILKPQKSDPSLEDLSTILMKLYNYSNLSSTKHNDTFVSLLNELKPNKSLKKDFLDWINSRLSEALCKYCQKRASNKSRYPTEYCDSCIQLLQSNFQCLRCLRKYQSRDYFSICCHFCIYCCCNFLRNGKNSCPTCLGSLDRVLSILGQCDNKYCKESKSLQLLIYDHCIVLLSCSHSFCGRCLMQIIKTKRCPIDNSEISKSRKNYIVNIFTDKCEKCGSRKAHSMLSKTDCFKKICQKCLSDHSSQCQVCSRLLVIK